MSKPAKKGSPRYDKKKGQPQRPPPSGTMPPRSAASLPRHIAKPGTPSPVVSLEPLAPLIVRSGRPFDDQAGADAARFPPPSTLAGCLRTAWARSTASAFGPELAEQLAVTGPLLFRPAAEPGGPSRLLAPKPADAHYFGHGEDARCLRAEPAPFDSGCGADLPQALAPVRLTEAVIGKPGAGPAWWDWEDLIAFRTGRMPTHGQLSSRGWSPPTGDRRTHVAIDPKTLAADTGRLFQTEGLDFAPTNPGLHADGSAQTLRLLARCSEALPEGLVHLGGERRLARLYPEPESLWPTCPADWCERILEAGGLTLMLLTPGVFAAGYRPGWLDAALEGEVPNAPGVRLRLVAAALERWQAHSGWDLAAHQPRPTRKLVAAGATYWFRLLHTPSPQALAALWLGSLCDQAQDRADGYGLALPAPWAPLQDC